MPYAPDHKLRTHARIVDVASRLFRRDGYEAVGIDTLMAAAGLTRGGFYAHFRDKARLLVEALDAGFDEAHEMLFDKGLAEKRGAAWREAAARRYLSLAHRDRREEGCVIAALGADVARAGAPARRAFGRRVDAIVDEIARRGELPRAEAIVLLCTWAGALLLARGVQDRERAEEILDAARRATSPRATPSAA